MTGFVVSLLVTGGVTGGVTESFFAGGVTISGVVVWLVVVVLASAEVFVSGTAVVFVAVSFDVSSARD